MQTVARSVVVPYTPEQMFQLVNDVPAYPEFLPWCHSSRVLNAQPDSITASITFAKGPVKHSFTTENKLIPAESVRMHLVEGPFKHLDGVWTFEPMPDGGARIKLYIEFEFSSRLLSTTLGPFFQQICVTLVQRFVARAKSVYGSPANSN